MQVCKYLAVLFLCLTPGVSLSVGAATPSTATATATATASSVGASKLDPAAAGDIASTMSGGKPAIVWTIAGSDSGGGAGIQADLHAMHAFGCHGCSAITCLTAQNSQGVSGVHAPPPEFLRLQLASLLEDLSPRAVKIGMLGTAALAQEVGAFLKQLKLQSKNKPWVVVDPVMISTSGHKLIDDETVEAMMNHVFPFADVLTPNKFEAEALLGRTLTTPQQVEEGARELLQKCGVPAILLKGGHSLAETNPQRLNADSPILEQDGSDTGCADVNATMGYAQDYFLSQDVREEERLCDGGVWLRSDRYDSENTHGTGCTLSSAMASALALGHEAQENALSSTGATIAMTPIDAACLAKAYVAAGIARGVQVRICIHADQQIKHLDTIPMNVTQRFPCSCILWIILLSSLCGVPKT
jgi:hydroxymethylpyrimidine kinase/phosphomethylpyrimidine kinase